MTSNSHFDLNTAREYAARGDIQSWVQAYLRAGTWANLPLADGLLRQQRWWLGPLHLGVDALIRVVGPEPDMEYHIPPDWWGQKVGTLAAGLLDLAALPPLIVECRPEGLSVRDGNHRLAAMRCKGWTSCWAIIWCNTEAERLALAQRYPQAA